MNLKQELTDHFNLMPDPGPYLSMIDSSISEVDQSAISAAVRAGYSGFEVQQWDTGSSFNGVPAGVARERLMCNCCWDGECPVWIYTDGHRIIRHGIGSTEDGQTDIENMISGNVDSAIFSAVAQRVTEKANQL